MEAPAQHRASTTGVGVPALQRADVSPERGPAPDHSHHHQEDNDGRGTPVDYGQYEGQMSALLAENSLPMGSEGAAELAAAYDDVLAWALDPEKMARYDFLNHFIHADSPDSLLCVAAAYVAWDTMRTWCVETRMRCTPAWPGRGGASCASYAC